MKRFTLQLTAITAFAIGLIWFAGKGEAIQAQQSARIPGADLFAAETLRIDVDDLQGGKANTVKNSEKSESRKLDNVLTGARKLSNVMMDIRNRYMDEVDVSDLVDAGIRGMLQNLDRYSVLMKTESYNNLMEHTSGRYQGVGMQIDSRNDYIVVVAPLEGGPSEKLGLRAGDVIKKIEDKSTYKMKTSDASKLMRGDAGTEIKVSIEREGVPDLLDFTIKRDFITLHSVNYAGKIPGTNVGYMRLSAFASNSKSELKAAIEKLKAQNVDGLVFDLRSNGGGLLDQAVSISELFLPKNSLIVYTQGRDESSRRSFYSRREPIFPDKPLIVLVDEGTASASEIVSGALQDHDRAIVLGNTTFGKGLVQQVFAFDEDQSAHLKLTTARYYVPSGRCIQRLDRQWKTREKNEHAAEVLSDSLTLEDREVFHTDNGRVVYGGGGIVPDVEAKLDFWKPITINMRRKSLFFDFASQYLAKHPDTKLDVTVSDDMVSEFKEFIESKDFDYKTALQVSFEGFKKTVTEEKQDDVFKSEIAAMEKLIAQGKQDDFKEALDDIKMGIKRELVSHIGGEKARYENFFLQIDPTIKQAVEIIENPKEYSQILTEGASRAQIDKKKPATE